MILKEMTIKNFKGIKEPLKIKFNPITLLFGPNSSGKSSIIQAINYAREIFISGGDASPDKQTKDNRIENLGSYRNITNNHDVAKPITFEFLLDYSEYPFLNFIPDNINTKLSSSYYLKDINNNFEEFIEKDSLSEIEYVSNKIHRIILKISIVWIQERRQPEIKTISVIVNDLPFYNVVTETSGNSDMLQILSFHNHPILPESIKVSLFYENENLLNSIYRDGIDEIYSKGLNKKDEKKNIEEYKKEFDLKWGKFLEESSEIRNNKDTNKILFSLEAKYRYNIRLFDELRYNWGEWELDNHFHQNLISILVTAPIKSVEYVLNENLAHIGPLREIPPRNYQPIKYSESFCWNKGLAAYDVLLHPSTTEDFINELNKWLLDKDYLNTGYYIELKRYSLIDEQSLLWKIINKNEEIGDIEKIKEIIKDELIKDIKTQFKIKDKRSDIELLLQDVGTGISQILPIVVGALWLKNKFITIEQPELHIHPAMQSEMGDLLIRSVRKNGGNNNFFLVETHSEHLMLRILRRIRETTDEENDKQLYLSPDDVAVYYIKSGENGVNATHIAVNEDGRFDSLWPDGFFAERSKELF